MVRSAWGHGVVTFPVVPLLGGSSPAAVPDKALPSVEELNYIELGIKGAEGVDF